MGREGVPDAMFSGLPLVNARRNRPCRLTLPPARAVATLPPLHEVPMRSSVVLARLLCVVGLAVATSGCATYRLRHTTPPLNNPIAVPFTNCDDLWNHIVDVVDDDFNIASEQRVRQSGEVLTVGRIDTTPQLGATLIEPWRGDAADAYQRLHGTLQTVRRRAVVQVIPAGDQFQIEAIVYKELEDLSRPEYSTAGAATFRNDGSLVRLEEATGVLQPTLGWIPLGRDMIMEQKLLAKIRARVVPAPPQAGGSWMNWFAAPSGETIPQGTTLQRPSGEMLPPTDGVGPVETIPPSMLPPSGPMLQPPPSSQPRPF